MITHVWEYVTGITHRFHDGGGLMIVTHRDPDAVWIEYLHALVIDNDEDDVEKTRLIKRWSSSPLPAPDFTLAVAGATETVVVFPNAGCC